MAHSGGRPPGTVDDWSRHDVELDRSEPRQNLLDLPTARIVAGEILPVGSEKRSSPPLGRQNDEGLRGQLRFLEPSPALLPARGPLAPTFPSSGVRARKAHSRSIRVAAH